MVVGATPDGPYPVTVNPSARSHTQEAFARTAASDARLFTRCLQPSDNAALRQLIDGPPNRQARVTGLERIVRAHLVCYPGFDPTSLSRTGHLGDCDPRGEFKPIIDAFGHLIDVAPLHIVCQSFFDRGALLERVLALYAPDLSFTTDQLLAPPVLARYHAREDRLDRSGSRPEQVDTEVVGCLVAVHPQWGLAYARAAVNGAAEARLRGALIGTAPAACIKGAKQVRVDPAEFRVFVADAVGAWALALRGADTLIPLG